MDDLTRDKLAIREVIECWAIWRDSGDFDRLRTCYHDDGRMHATWFQGTADQFVAGARESFAKGNMSSHTLGGSAIDIAGSRAIAQTRLTLQSRAMLAGVLCDITCIGRFYDFFEKRAGRWAIAERRLTYEKDRADPVMPGTMPVLDKPKLEAFPQGYRFLAYAQTERGQDVHRNLPGLRGPEVEGLYAAGKSWLAGKWR